MNQRVLITAGAAGIGREFARAFAAAGARVFVCDIDDEGLAQLAGEIPGLLARRCDMGDRGQIEAMVPAAIEQLGGLDVLINNAGVSGPTAPTEALSPADWDKVVQVNLTATFDVTRLAIPELKRSGNGVVINMSSVAGRFGYANRIAYASSKWAIVGFTKSLSIELGEFGVRVNAILPGTVEGDRLRRVFEGRAQLSGQSVDEITRVAMSNQSLQRLVDPRDIAALAVFLASDAGKSISGQALPIDNDIQRL